MARRTGTTSTVVYVDIKGRSDNKEGFEKTIVWLNHQEKISTSITTLIEMAILRFGIRDITDPLIQRELYSDTEFESTLNQYMGQFKKEPVPEEIEKKRKTTRIPIFSKNTSSYDEDMLERWVNVQYNLSASVRMLIVDAIERFGYAKITTSVIRQALTLYHSCVKLYQNGSLDKEDAVNLLSAMLANLDMDDKGDTLNVQLKQANTLAVETEHNEIPVNDTKPTENKKTALIQDESPLPKKEESSPKNNDNNEEDKDDKEGELDLSLF